MAVSMRSVLDFVLRYEQKLQPSTWECRVHTPAEKMLAAGTPHLSKVSLTASSRFKRYFCQINCRKKNRQIARRSNYWRRRCCKKNWCFGNSTDLQAHFKKYYWLGFVVCASVFTCLGSGSNCCEKTNYAFKTKLIYNHLTTQKLDFVAKNLFKLAFCCKFAVSK